jgi:hypothetical protein
MLPFSEKDKTIAGVTGILAGTIATACTLLGLDATQYDPEAFATPVKILQMEDLSLTKLRWFMILDMFGYYLLLLPIIFYVAKKLAVKTAWSDMFTWLGLSYVLIGAIGAAVLAVVWPQMIDAYRNAAEGNREIYAMGFLMFNDFVTGGLWNVLEVLLGGAWWMATAQLFHNKALKVTTIVLAVACFADSAGNLFQIHVISEIGLNVYLVLSMIWPAWVGVQILREKF